MRSSAIYIRVFSYNWPNKVGLNWLMIKTLRLTINDVSQQKLSCNIMIVTTGKRRKPQDKSYIGLDTLALVSVTKNKNVTHSNKDIILDIPILMYLVNPIDTIIHLSWFNSNEKSMEKVECKTWKCTNYQFIKLSYSWINPFICINLQEKRISAGLQLLYLIFAPPSANLITWYQLICV